MLIEGLGEDYASHALSGTYFLYNGTPCIIRAVRNSNVLVRNIVDSSTFDIEASYFTGWSELKYPRLGYRKLDNGMWGWVGRAARSYSRGLNADNIRISATPYLSSPEGSQVFMADHDFRAVHYSEEMYDNAEMLSSLMRAALVPVWDGGKEFTEMLGRKDMAFIPSERFMIEPLAHSDKYGVYMSNAMIGRIDSDLNVYGPKKNAGIIEQMVKRYAA